MAAGGWLRGCRWGWSWAWCCFRLGWWRRGCLDWVWRFRGGLVVWFVLLRFLVYISTCSNVVSYAWDTLGWVVAQKSRLSEVEDSLAPPPHKCRCPRATRRTGCHVSGRAVSLRGRR